MLKKTFETIDRVFGWIEDWSLLLSVIIALLVAMANVLLRKFTADFNLYWSDEVVRKTIYVSTYIGCVVAIRNRSMIRIDALPQMVPWLKKPLTVFSHLVVLLFSACMIYLGGMMTHMQYLDIYAKTSSLRIPEWIFYAVLPMMGVMMFVRTLMVLADDWKEGANS
ncbi:TRAP transporter small permease [Geopsychrobacter electrodiphilus]|uniref:TRAP transporter small permease n=1 Tax=Geopsychrobacter electrodiphilus TaxID=225196 RepID=UPI000369D7A3|nr:TRAP transporter small permease [Geopsychrobacter electrodiphilus]